ncbi:MAG: hypothetical protein HC842_07405 [Cytophagales bacterium]|nr:hypothetical protein [Cytophagales bacterium]
MLAAWLLGSLALPAALLLLVWLAGQAAVLLGAALLSAQAHTVWIGAEGLWAIWGPYLWFQPVLLFGAVAFARNRLAKTLLYSLLIMAALGLFNVALFFGLNGHYLWAHFSLMEGNQLMMDGSPYQWLKWILLTVWWLALLLAAYFKLTEKEG